MNCYNIKNSLLLTILLHMTLTAHYDKKTLPIQQEENAVAGKRNSLFLSSNTQACNETASYDILSFFKKKFEPIVTSQHNYTQIQQKLLAELFYQFIQEPEVMLLFDQWFYSLTSTQAQTAATELLVSGVNKYLTTHLRKKSVHYISSLPEGLIKEAGRFLYLQHYGDACDDDYISLSFASRLMECSKTHSLNLSHIAFVQLPLFEKRLKNILQIASAVCNGPIKELYINNNFLTELPFCWIPTLEFLDASNNNIRKISVQAFPALECIDVSNNRLTTFPPLSIPKIKTFIARDNNITFIPTINFQELEYLDLSNNQIKQLPELRGLPHIREIHLYKNPLSRIYEQKSTVKNYNIYY